LAVASPIVRVLARPDERNNGEELPVIHNCPRATGAAEKVTVGDPEFASKIATSAIVGTVAPETPPEVADQLVVLVQTPVPPVTQYRLAPRLDKEKIIIRRMVVILFLKFLPDSIPENQEVDEETPLNDFTSPESGKKRIFNADTSLLRLI
jgi:hypothetical protein